VALAGLVLVKTLGSEPALPPWLRGCTGTAPSPSFGLPHHVHEIGPIPTRKISLTPEQDAFIDEMLKAGEYRNASAAVRDAIRTLQQRRAEEELEIQR
jgi:putative addiction module CopG family antidote